MAVKEFLCMVLIAVVHNRTIVACEEYDGVVSYTETLERSHNLTHGPVELYDGIATESHAAVFADFLLQT